MLEHSAQLQPQARPQAAPRPVVREGFCANRGAIASMGFLAGWLPVNCCSVGLVPAIASGLGLGSGYFALNKTLFFGLGWTPVWALIGLGFVLVASRVMTRRAFVSLPREIAVRSYWRTAGLTALAAGLTFIAWTELVMPLMYMFGVPMGSLFTK